MDGDHRTFWRREVNDVSILFEHIHLLNGLDGLDIEFLKGCLQFLVVGAGGFMDFLLFSSWCAFASI